MDVSAAAAAAAAQPFFIPDDLLLHGISKLPTNLVQRWKSVSSALNKKISTHEFSQMRAKNLVLLRISNSLYLLDPSHPFPSVQEIRCPPMPGSSSSFADYHIAGEAKGITSLLRLISADERAVAAYNPATRCSHRLPDQPLAEIARNSIAYGLGYHLSSADMFYVTLGSYNPLTKSSEGKNLDVYSFASNEWISHPNIELKVNDFSTRAGIYSNHSINWLLTNEPSVDNKIIKLDLDCFGLSELSLPPQVKELSYGKVYLGRMSGCLSVVHHSHGKLEAYLKTKYHNWSKAWSCVLVANGIYPLNYLCNLDDGRVLLYQCFEGFSLFDPVTQFTSHFGQELEIDDQDFLEAVPLIETFVNLPRFPLVDEAALPATVPIQAAAAAPPTDGKEKQD